MWVNNQEEDENKNQGINNTSVGSGGGSSSGSNTPQGNPSTISPVSSNQPQQNFATIQDYLGANKQQGEDLGQKVTSSLSDTQNQEKGTIDTSANNVTNALNSSSTYNPDIVKSSLDNPTDVLNDPNKLSAYLNQSSGAYTGPSSFESTADYNTAAGAANEANQKVAELGTTGGREQLLQDQFGVYGQGNKGLDQAILQSSSAFPTLQEQGKQFATIPDYLASKANDIDTGAIPLAKTNAASNAAQTQSDFNTGVKNFENQINTEATNNIAPENRDTWNTVAQEFAAQPGFQTPTQNPGVDLARYLTATPEERAKYADLLKLSGQPNNFFPAYAKTPQMDQLAGILNSLRTRG